jgi:hypothetical protein
LEWLIDERIQSLALPSSGRFRRARQERGGERHFVKPAFLPIQ